MPHYNKPILEAADDKLDSTVVAKDLKANQFVKEFAIRDKYYPLVASWLPKTEKVLFRYIDEYYNRNVDLLSSPYPIRYPVFDVEDYKIVFKCTTINENEVKALIKVVNLPDDVKSRDSFSAFATVMLLIIRYYILTNQPGKLRKVMAYYGYSIFWSRYTRFFKHYLPSSSEKGKKVMVYTIENMNRKFVWKMYGNMNDVIIHGVEVALNRHPEHVQIMSDYYIYYVNNIVRQTIKGHIKTLANEFYDNAEAGNIIHDNSVQMEEDGSLKDDNSDSANIETLAQEFTSVFFSSKMNPQLVDISAAAAGEVSKKELKIVIDELKHIGEVQDVHDFYASLFSLYFNSEDKNVSIDNVKTMKFAALMRNIYKKGNSLDPNIVKVRAILGKWLESTSNVYRLTNREPTKNSYRLAVYLYFIFVVSWNK